MEIQTEIQIKLKNQIDTKNINEIELGIELKTQSCWNEVGPEKQAQIKYE